MEEFFDIGETFVAPYTYQSNSIDGTFTPANGNFKFRGILGVHEETQDPGYPDRPRLIITGGKVTLLSIVGDDGFTQAGYREGFGGDWNFDGNVYGFLTITHPVRQFPVPDGGGTLPLLAVALIVFIGLSPQLRSVLKHPRIGSPSGSRCEPTWPNLQFHDGAVSADLVVPW
jgi:hypothetical protein